MAALLQSNLDKPFYVWGEDALLSWPGAEPALIAERDAFMARVLAATATGHNSNAPAFVAEEVSGVYGYRCHAHTLACFNSLADAVLGWQWAGSQRREQRQ